MALIYSNLNRLFAGSILRNLGNASSGQPGPFTLGVTVYSGVAPAASAIVDSWATYNSSASNYLLHYTNMGWSQPVQGPLLQLSTLPTAVTPVRSGTASWAIIWAGQPSAPQLDGTTLPFAKFLVVSVSDSNGSGVIRFASTALTTAAPVGVIGASMAAFI